MIAEQPIPDLSPQDRATLLALLDPSRPFSHLSSPSDPSPDPLTAATFLARPDIQPHLEALRALFAFRQEIERQHRTDQLVDALLEIAKTSPDLTQRRLAATTALRALYPQSRGRKHAEGAPNPTPRPQQTNTPTQPQTTPTGPTPQRGAGPVHAQREPGGGASAPVTPPTNPIPSVPIPPSLAALNAALTQPSGAGHSGPPPSLPSLLPPDPSAHPTTNNTPTLPNQPSWVPLVEDQCQTVHALPQQPISGPVLLTLTNDHPLHTDPPPPDDTS